MSYLARLFPRATAVNACAALSFLLVSALPAVAQVDASTVFYLPFNGSLNGAQGQTPTASQNVAFVPGLSGQAATFSALSDLQYASTGNLNAFEGTLEFFVKADWNINPSQGFTFFTVAGDSGMIFSKDGANNLRGIFNRFGADGNPEVGTPAISVDSLGWTAGEWHSFAYTWSNTTKEVQLYLDGLPASSATFINDLPPIRPNEAVFWVGQGTSNGEKLNGLLDELRISSRVRTAGEILSRYNSIVVVPEAGTLALLGFALVPVGFGLVRSHTGAVRRK